MVEFLIPMWMAILTFIIIILYPHRKTCFQWFWKRQREREGETSVWDRNVNWLPARACPDQESNLQPGHERWPGTKPATFWSALQEHPLTNWVTPLGLYKIFNNHRICSNCLGRGLKTWAPGWGHLGLNPGSVWLWASDLPPPTLQLLHLQNRDTIVVSL